MLLILLLVLVFFGSPLAVEAAIKVTPVLRHILFGQSHQVWHIQPSLSGIGSWAQLSTHLEVSLAQGSQARLACMEDIRSAYRSHQVGTRKLVVCRRTHGSCQEHQKLLGWCNTIMESQVAAAICTEVGLGQVV